MPVDLEYDDVVVNLKVIASICVNTKLYTKGPYLNIEQPMFIPESVRRWYRQDSRDESIKRIDRTIARSIAYLEKDKDKEKQMAMYLTDATKGIINMKDTYSSCVQTVARLDTILDKIQTSMVGIQVDDEKTDEPRVKIEPSIVKRVEYNDVLNVYQDNSSNTQTSVNIEQDESNFNKSPKPESNVENKTDGKLKLKK